MKKTVLLALVALTITLNPLFAKAKQVEGSVNLNTASVEELTLLPGIGKVKAEAIVAFRQSHPFKSVAELSEVKGIGPKLLQKMEKFLTLQGPSTIHTVNPPTASAAVVAPVAAH